MSQLALHHVAVIVTDLGKSLPFYRDVFGLAEIERPPFPFPGAWLACGALQVHLIAHPDGGTFRTDPAINRNDLHFAFRTDDFEGMIVKLTAMGFREDADDGDPMRMLVNRNAMAGFPQIYLLDPDRNIVEINGAPAG